MAEKILLIDLSEKTAESLPYTCEHDGAYGRGLALNLIENNVPVDAGRYSNENVLVIVPGLFVGNKAPSAVRMMVAAAEGKGKGMQICNITGNMPQKLGSLGIAGLVVKGIAEEKNTVVRISENGVEFSVKPELGGIGVGDIVHTLKKDINSDIAIIGTGKCGDMRMSLSSMFLTYPDGRPEYHCPRNSFGDIFGAKNLRAIVIDGKNYFSRDNNDPDAFWDISKELTQKIINDEVCGGALPSYGSITIMKILRNKALLAELSEHDVKQKAEVQKPVKADNAENDRVRVNRTCAPMCVIGCLNRHGGKDGRKYESPSQVEVEAAVMKSFGVEDFELSKAIQNKATEMSLVSVEYVTAAKAYAEATGIEHGEEYLLEWLDEIEQGTPVGRMIASRTYGIGRLYEDKHIEHLMDRKAADDEGLLNVDVNSRYPRLKGMSATDLLYAQIFVLENLGFCIFTSFALLDSDDTFEKLARMFTLRTGIDISGEELIIQANECIKAEKEFEEKRWRAARQANIPMFTKVLYRYFDNNRE